MIKVKQKSLKKHNKKTNPSPKIQVFKMSFFFGPTRPPQQSPPCHYQGLVPAIGTFGLLGPVWRWRIPSYGIGLWNPPKMGISWNYPPAPSKSHHQKKNAFLAGNPQQKPSFVTVCWGVRLKGILWWWFQLFLLLMFIPSWRENDSNFTKRWLNPPTRQHLAMLGRLVKGVYEEFSGTRNKNRMYTLSCPPSHPFPVIVADEGLSGFAPLNLGWCF